jgi:Mg/Co/Ni transporter MgtE
MYLVRVGECPATYQVERRSPMITVRKEMTVGMAMGALLLMLSGSALWVIWGQSPIFLTDRAG